MSSLSNFLAYGAMGLGLALAVLAYQLLRKEQGIAKPRNEIVKAIYVFMGFALVLAFGGFVSEFMKAGAGPLKAQLEEKNRRLTEMEEKYQLLSTLETK